MSADEDSFIVLDETPSMLQYSILDSSTLSGDSIIERQSVITNGSEKPNDIWYKEPAKVSVVDGPSKASIPNAVEDIAQISLPISESSQETSFKSNLVSSLTQTTSPPNTTRTPAKTTLAQSFLLGAIDCDTMKGNVKSYFPSLSNSTHPEDIEKLQSLIQERNDLKDTLQRTNVTMRQQFSLVNNWHNNVKALKEQHEVELKKSKNINDELFKQNHELQEKIDELQQLAELSRQQNDQIRLNTQKTETSRFEAEIRELKLQLAGAIANNVELDEIRKENEERLKVELTASQSLYKNATEEIAKLKIQTETAKEDLNRAKHLVEKYREELDIVGAQCEVYKADFEKERTDRQKMAGEREQMIADIKMLKKRNQALVDEAQSFYSETSATSLTSNGIGEMTAGSEDGAAALESEPSPQYVCPICAVEYERLNELESHVQSCLERAT